MNTSSASDRGPREVVTGARYVEQITALESDRLARAAFRDLVLSIASPGATVFDFGSGTGMDARFYAERGLIVTAYDVDPHMCEFFGEYCRDLIEAGRITLQQGSYHDFLASRKLAGVDLVTSNFAPLNLVGNLQELFAKFHALTRPGGRVLASVLSPYFVGDLKYGWWWRNAPRLWRTGHFSVPGAQAPIVRRARSDFARQSAPHFTLERVFRGLSSFSKRDMAGLDMNGVALHRALRVSTCRFMFLLFVRRDLGTGGNS